MCGTVEPTLLLLAWACLFAGHIAGLSNIRRMAKCLDGERSLLYGFLLPYSWVF